MTARPALFLDRDGTLVEEVGPLGDPDRLRLLPGVSAALRRAAEAGFACVVVTNQSGVARGLYEEADVARVHAALRARLAEGGARLDAIEACPHHPDAPRARYRLRCDCRKPAPGLILRAARRLGLDLARSWTVGDRLRDARAGEAAGTAALLVRTGHGAREIEYHSARGARLPRAVDDLEHAVDLILAGATPRAAGSA